MHRSTVYLLLGLGALAIILVAYTRQPTLALETVSHVRDTENPSGFFGIDVAAYGHYVYVLTGDNGARTLAPDSLRIIDVADPRHPIETSVLKLQGRPESLIVHNDYVYSLIHCAPDDYYRYCLAIIDISDKAHTQMMGEFQWPSHIQGVSMAMISDSILYITDGNTIKILDISNPRAPTLIGEQILGGSVRDFVAIGNTAYGCIGGGLVVLDVSDPRKPIENERLGIAEGCRVMTGNQDYLLVANVKPQLDLYDITQPLRPVRVSSIDLVSEPGELDATETYAFVRVGITIAQRPGIQVVDLTAPMGPRNLGVAYADNFGGNIWGIAASGIYIYSVWDGLWTLKFGRD